MAADCRKHFSYLFGIFFIICSYILTFAQTDLNEVHIRPAVGLLPSGITDASTSSHSEVIRKNVDLVLVPVTITDNVNRLAVGLDKKNFELLENKKPQEISHFSSDDAPLSIGIILDTSGSMAEKIDRAREAVMQFCETANPQDQFFMITFSDIPTLVNDFTSNMQEIQNHLLYANTKGRTSLLDAIYLAMTKMREATQPRKALLIISDGGDNRSRYTKKEIESSIKESDVMVYAIGLYDRTFQTEEERQGPLLLSNLAEVTGGSAYTIENPNDLPLVAERIGRELRTQYMIGYHPKDTARDGKWHKIKIQLKIPKQLSFLRVHARTGYYAPKE